MKTKHIWVSVATLAIVTGIGYRWGRAPHAPTAVNPASVVKPPSSASTNFISRWPALVSDLQRAKETAGTLAEIRRWLASLPPATASATIREALQAGYDAPTHAEFKVGAKGWLTSAPSLRVWLLDYLEQIDPVAAKAYAAEVLREMRSAEEWAVALRTYARVGVLGEDRSFIENKMQGLLHNETWQHEASVGYLEAFDVAVFLGGTNLLPGLTDLVRKQDNPAVAHAAFLSLDRLTQANPAATLTCLLGDNGAMQGREETRANYFARADVSEGAQRALVEQYLLDPQRSPVELRTFAGVFPNANFMISQNLLTTVETPDRGALSRRDQAALAVVTAWQRDPRFDRLQPQLEVMRRRLEGFVHPTP